MQVSPGKGKLGEGVGCEVADGRVGQELHHLQVSRNSEKVNTLWKISSISQLDECN